MKVILVIWDACRADHLSAYGYHRPTTPFIDSQPHVLFERCYSFYSVTPASVYSILRGKALPELKGIPRRIIRTPAITDLFPVSAAVVSTEVLHERFGWPAFFTHYHRVPRDTDDVTRKAIELDRQMGDDYFMMVHYAYTHTRYSPGPFKGHFHNGPPHPIHVCLDTQEFKRMKGERMMLYAQIDGSNDANYHIARYDEAVLRSDHHLEWLYSEVAKGEYMIILTADHGELMGEEGIYFTHDLGTRLGKEPPYSKFDEALFRVPLILLSHRRRRQTIPGPVDHTIIATLITELRQT